MLLRTYLKHMITFIFINASAFSLVVAEDYYDLTYDLTIVGPVSFSQGIGRQAIGLAECLKNEAAINIIPTTPPKLQDLPSDINKMITRKEVPPGTVAILESPLNEADVKKVPKSFIKLAYSMVESTKIPKKWTKMLNEHFDGVIVPDKYFVNVYKNSGVQIPVFVVPLGIYIDKMLQQDPKIDKKKPFVFGSTVRLSNRKNIKRLINAFVKEFGDDPNVCLRLNGGGNEGWLVDYITNVRNLIKKLACKNVILTNDSLAWESYIELVSSFDCFVNIAKGEGFSHTPREAMAMGIPCVLSDNTAQSTICASGFVRSVPSLIEEPAFLNGPEQLGVWFDCTDNDVRKALRDVYENYGKYKALALLGREWVQQYQWKNLRKQYLNLVKPAKIILGDRDEVTDDYLMTQSESLYNKYNQVLQGNVIP